MDINKVLGEKKLTKYRLSKESGISYSTINDLCSGKTKISKCSGETLYKVSKVLDISMEELVASCISEVNKNNIDEILDAIKRKNNI